MCDFSQNNSETIEAILKALNTKIFSTPTTEGDENKKRHDSNRNSRMRGKVAEPRATGDSTSSFFNASNASKAVKQTKKRAERQKLTKTSTSRSSSKNNNNNNDNSNNPSNKSSDTYRNVIEPDDDDVDDGNGDGNVDENDDAADANEACLGYTQNDDEWQSVNDDNNISETDDNEDLNEEEKQFTPTSRSKNKLLIMLEQQEQQSKSQHLQQQHEKAATQQQSLQQQQQQPKRKQSKNQPPKTRQQMRTELFLQRKRQQEQQLQQQQQQLKELHELHKQLIQKQNKHKPPVHRKQSAKRSGGQHSNHQQATEKQQRHKSQDRLQPQRNATPMNQHQMQRRMSQRQVKERMPSRERDFQPLLPLQKSLRQLRNSTDTLTPCAAVSNPITTMNKKHSAAATPLSAVTSAAHSEMIIGQQRSQKQKQQYFYQQQQQQQLQQQQLQQQQQQQEEEDLHSHRSVAPCHMNKARLFKKRRNPLRSPPPAPSVTPLNSARSIRSARCHAGSDIDISDIDDDDDDDACVEELPHAMTHLGSANTNYSRECNNTNNNANKFYNYNNHTGDNETQTSARSHEVPPTAASNAVDDCAAANVEATLKRSLEMNQNDAAAAAKAIAAALETINVNENTNVLNLLQSRVISDVLVKCLIGVNPAAVGATEDSEDEDNQNEDDDNDDDEINEDDDGDDDDDGEKEFEFDEGMPKNTTRHNNSKVNVGRTASFRGGNEDVSTDTEGRDVIEVASYISTSRKRRGRKTLEQQVRQNYQQQLNSLYASNSAFTMEKLQQMQQQLHHYESESQKELHMKLLCQQNDQNDRRSETDFQLQQMQQFAEPQNQKQLHMQQLLLDQGLMFNPEIEQQNSQQNPQQPRRPLNDINYLNSLSNKTTVKENALSQVFMEVLERNKQQQRVNYEKPDLKVDSFINARDQFLNLCSKNRFYVNPNYAEPWKVFSRLSAKLASEIVSSVEEDFSIGVSKFVQDFLELEAHN